MYCLAQVLLLTSQGFCLNELLFFKSQKFDERFVKESGDTYFINPRNAKNMEHVIGMAICVSNTGYVNPLLA